MRIIRIIFLFIISILLGACQQRKSQSPAHFRIISLIPNTQAELTIRSKGKTKKVNKSISLDYSTPVEYQTFPPGHYELTYTVNGKKLLKGSYVLGKNGYYTMLTTGLLPEKWKINPQSLTYSIKYILAGSEVVDTNHNLPQWFMMRDNYDGSSNHAYFRFVNANPYASELTVKDSKKTLTSKLAYPRETDMIKVKAGQHPLQFNYGDVKLADKTVNAKEGYVYSIILGPGEEGRKLAVSVVENPTRTLLMTK